MMEHAERQLEDALGAFNRLVTEDLARYRARVRSAGLNLIPTVERLELDWARGGLTPP